MNASFSSDFDLPLLLQPNVISSRLTATGAEANYATILANARKYKSDAKIEGIQVQQMLLGGQEDYRRGVTMAKAKKVVRREWTKADVRPMKTMAKAKAGTTKIARSLKRSPAATAVMAAKFSVSLSMRV